MVEQLALQREEEEEESITTDRPSKLIWDAKGHSSQEALNPQDWKLSCELTQDMISAELTDWLCYCEYSCRRTSFLFTGKLQNDRLIFMLIDGIIYVRFFTSVQQQRRFEVHKRVSVYLYNFYENRKQLKTSSLCSDWPAPAAWIDQTHLFSIM